MNLSQRMSQAFGRPQLPLCLFYDFTFALRFELGGEIDGIADPVPRFLQAIDRARAVAHDLFDSSPRLDVVFAIYASRNIGQIARQRIRELASSGFDSRRVRHLGRTAVGKNNLNRHWYGCTLATPTTDIDRLLWCAVAKEMQISPKANFEFYLVDFDGQIILHLYDDRGMDVVAMSIDRLRPTYHRYNAWLLDYDRFRMDSTFAS
jgi:hypothetical protein